MRRQPADLLAVEAVMEPPVGRSMPAIRLKVVLLPEPLGPMRPRISPGLSSKDTWLTARNPPKRLDRPDTASIAQRIA